MTMRVLINDHSGHPFQVQLSRHLATLGHQVLHTYNASFQTPRGNMTKQPEDSANFNILGITLSEPFAKYSFLKRRRQEREYGRRLVRVIEKFQPDVLISSNTPIDAQGIIQNSCRRRGIPFILWLQDIYGIAIGHILKRKLGFLGSLIGRYFLRLEKRQLRRSKAVVTITADFDPYLIRWGIPSENIHAIPNWAPIDELPLRPKGNAWAAKFGLNEARVFLYSGTMGMKHNPDLLVALATHFRDNPQVRIVVISEGIGADYLREKREALGLKNLMLLDFQPFEDIPDVLGAADVVLAVLEKEAGVFSVPSKVLSYLCSGRPILLAVPDNNLASRIVAENGAGLTVEPDNLNGFIQAATQLIDDQALREKMGAQARHYAETTFDIINIGRKFSTIIKSAVYAE